MASFSTLEMLTKWFQSARLVTRTKESNTSASVKVENLLCSGTRNESEGVFGTLRRDLDFYVRI